MTLKPVITEKSMLAASHGRFSFWVDTKANKHQIAMLVKEAFGVNPISVTTVTVKGKTKRSWRKRQNFQQSNRKKAILTLKPGEKIDLFDVSSEKQATK